MKKLFYSFVCLLFVFNWAVYAQESDEKSVVKNEISVSTSKLSFDNLSLKYARSISNDLWLKVGVINLEGSFHKNIPSVGSCITKDSQINEGLLIGIEKQKTVNKLEFNYGMNVQMLYNHTRYTTENPSTPVNQRDIDVYKYSPGIGFGLGFFYKINPSILLGFEINPSINYSFTNGESTSTGYAYKNRDFYFSFTNNGALVTLKYRF
jgi:hypothetical protein